MIPPRLQSGVNLQVCFVNDSSSDKDSDAEDTRTETSLDTPLSPVVRRHCTIAVAASDSFSLQPHQFPSPAALESIKHDIGSLTCATFSPEQAELIAVRPRHGRGGLGPTGWLRRVLAGAAQVAGRGPGGTGSGPTHGPNAGGGGEADPAPQTLTCGWPG